MPICLEQEGARSKYNEPRLRLRDELLDSASVVELGGVHPQDVGVWGIVVSIPPVLSVRDVLLNVENELPGRVLGRNVELFSWDLQEVTVV